MQADFKDGTDQPPSRLEEGEMRKEEKYSRWQDIMLTPPTHLCDIDHVRDQSKAIQFEL